MKKRDQDDSVNAKSDAQNIPAEELTFDLHSPTVSGGFLRAVEEGKLEQINLLVINYAKLANRLHEVEGKLLACNSPKHLVEFGKYCLKRGFNTNSELRKLIRKYEKQKIELHRKLAKLENKISREGIPLPQSLNPNSTPPPTPISLVPTKQVEGNRLIAERNNLIFTNRTLPMPSICKRLDSKFGIDTPKVMPESWSEQYEVKTFLEAYNNENCKPLVQALISKAKRRRHSYLLI